MRGSTARSTARRVARGGLLLALLGVACTGLAGCGDTGKDSGSGGSVSVTPGAGSTALTIVYDDGKGGGAKTWRLTCDPAGGDHPDPAAACAALASGAKTGLAPVPADTMCTEIFGGPQTAKITGSWRGEDVDATLKRTDGCEISRWEALAGLLPAE